MPDYSNGKIYIIRSYQTDKVYIGSTTLSLCARLGEHKRLYRYWTQGTGKDKQKRCLCKSSEIIQYGDAYIELLETVSCKTKEELLQKEKEYIRKESTAVNRNLPLRTNKEWYNDNIEKRRAYDRMKYAKKKQLCVVSENQSQ